MSCWISESEESGCDVRKEGKEGERRGRRFRPDRNFNHGF